jgi:hypothetical protein
MRFVALLGRACLLGLPIAYFRLPIGEVDATECDKMRHFFKYIQYLLTQSSVDKCFIGEGLRDGG